MALLCTNAPLLSSLYQAMQPTYNTGPTVRGVLLVDLPYSMHAICFSSRCTFPAKHQTRMYYVLVNKISEFKDKYFIILDGSWLKIWSEMLM